MELKDIHIKQTAMFNNLVIELFDILERNKYLLMGKGIHLKSIQRDMSRLTKIRDEVQAYKLKELFDEKENLEK